MDRLVTPLIMLLIIGMCGVAIWLGNYQGNTNTHRSAVAGARGEVVSYAGGYLAIDFDTSLVSSCGDTSIYGYVQTPDGFKVQLKSVFVPEKIAKQFMAQQGNVLLFPVWDVMVFLAEPGIYTLEFYVQNNCSFLSHESIAIERIPFVVSPPQQEEMRL